MTSIHPLSSSQIDISLVEMENVLKSIDIDTNISNNTTTTIIHELDNSNINIDDSNSKTTSTQPSNDVSQPTSNTIVNIKEITNVEPIKTNITKDKQYIIKTRFGQLELTFDRVLAILIMLLAIITLFIMAILSASTLILKTNTENKTFDHATQITKNLIRLNTYYNIIMDGEIVELLVEEINETMEDVTTDYNKLIIDIPYTGNTDIYSRSSVITIISGFFKSFEINHFYLYNKVISNNFTDSNYFHSKYYPSIVNFTQSIDLALILADKAASNEDDYMNLNAIIDLVLTVFVLLIIIPSVIFILIKSGVNDYKFLDKLQRVDARVVIETIADPRLQYDFKELCQEHSQLSKFLFMERVQSFNEICQTIFTLQDEIEDGVTVEMSKTLLYEIDKLETKKFELAFEIITEYLDMESDTFLGYPLLGGKRNVEKVKRFFDNQSVHLPEDLFKNIQSNVSLNLFPIYKLFKSNQERTRINCFGPVLRF